jgi:hypothetical protein
MKIKSNITIAAHQFDLNHTALVNTLTECKLNTERTRFWTTDNNLKRVLFDMDTELDKLIVKAKSIR